MFILGLICSHSISVHSVDINGDEEDKNLLQSDEHQHLSERS